MFKLKIDGKHYLFDGMIRELPKLMETLDSLRRCTEKYVGGDIDYEYIVEGPLKIELKSIDSSSVKVQTEDEKLEAEMNKHKDNAESYYKWYTNEKAKSEKLQKQIDQLMECVSELKGNKESPMPE